MQAIISVLNEIYSKCEIENRWCVLIINKIPAFSSITFSTMIEKAFIPALWPITRNCGKSGTSVLFCSRFVQTKKRLNE